MIRLILLSFIIFNLSSLVFSQDINIKWIHKNHKVIVLDTNIADSVWVLDTFSFVNTTKSKFTINKILNENANYFTFSKKSIAKGSVGHIYYAEKISTRDYIGIKKNISVWFTFKTDKSENFTHVINYLIARNDRRNPLKIIKNSIGKIELIIEQNPNSHFYQELRIQPNGVAKSLCTFYEDSIPVGVWFFWDANGIESDSTISGFGGYYVYEKGNPFPIESKVKIKTNEKWVIPKFYCSIDDYYKIRSMNIVLPIGTDSVMFYTDSTYCYINIVKRALSIQKVYLLKPEDKYCYSPDGIQMPIYPISNSYLISWVGFYLESTRKLYEELLTSRYSEIKIKPVYVAKTAKVSCMLINDSLSKIEKDKLLKKLCNEPYVSGFKQLYYTFDDTFPRIFQNCINIEFDPLVSIDVVDSILNKYNFDRYHYEGEQDSINHIGYRLNYKKKIIDESSLEDFNGLFNEKIVQYYRID